MPSSSVEDRKDAMTMTRRCRATRQGRARTLLSILAVAALVVGSSTCYCGMSIAPATAAALDYFVDPVHGSDSNAGTTASTAFKTLHKAANTIALPPTTLRKDSVTVHLLAGDHDVSTGALQLNSSHSGTVTAPVTFTAAASTKARVHAGYNIPLESAKQATLPSGAVGYIVDLKAAGVTQYGNITANTGLGDCPSAHGEGRMELFVNGEPLVLARWPNINRTSGYWRWDNIAAVQNDQTQFSYASTLDRPANWTKEADLWLWGYWKFDWADSVVKVASINTTSRQFSIDKSTPPTYGFEAKARWLAFNALVELDAPGEFYVDRQTGTLYFIPPVPMAQVVELAVSVGEEAITVNEAQNIFFEGLQAVYTKGNGVVVSASNNITFSNGIVTCVGGNGITMTGAGNAILGTEVTHSGCKGISIEGGDIPTITSSENLVRNSTVYGFSRHTRTYNPGLSWGGVGLTVSGNLFKDAPHSAILGGGMLSLFEHNTIMDVGFEVDDSGAFYTGRSWIELGNTIRYNTFKSIRTRVPVFLGSPSVQGIYLDDEMSGYSVYNNSFFDCQVGMFIGGGRWNSVKFNVFEQCDTAVHVDDRGLGWQKDFCEDPSNYQAQLHSVNYQQPPFSTQFPMIVNTLEEMPCYPVYNQIVSNGACNCQQFLDFSTAQLLEWRNIVASNNASLPSGCSQA